MDRKKKMYTAKCSQCSRRFRAYTRAALLSNIRKHMWEAPTTGMVLTAIAQGIPVALALIRLVKKPRWNKLETAVSSFEPYMKPETRIAWQTVKTIRDIDFRRGK